MVLVLVVVEEVMCIDDKCKKEGSYLLMGTLI